VFWASRQKVKRMSGLWASISQNVVATVRLGQTGGPTAVQARPAESSGGRARPGHRWPGQGSQGHRRPGQVTRARPLQASPGHNRPAKRSRVQPSRAGLEQAGPSQARTARPLPANPLPAMPGHRPGNRWPDLARPTRAGLGRSEPDWARPGWPDHCRRSHRQPGQATSGQAVRPGLPALGQGWARQPRPPPRARAGLALGHRRRGPANPADSKPPYFFNFKPQT